MRKIIVYKNGMQFFAENIEILTSLDVKEEVDVTHFDEETVAKLRENPRDFDVIKDKSGKATGIRKKKNP